MYMRLLRRKLCYSVCVCATFGSPSIIDGVRKGRISVYPPVHYALSLAMPNSLIYPGNGELTQEKVDERWSRGDFLLNSADGLRFRVESCQLFSAR